MVSTDIKEINPYHEGQKIGVTFSAFDFIHPGHCWMLKDCKTKCDYLIVGIQIDPSNKQDLEHRKKTGLKNKPIYTLEERIAVIESIKYVDAYFTYETEKDLYKWLSENKWDTRVLGSDWEGKNFTGYDIKKGEFYFHKREHNLSSTEIKKRLLNQGKLIEKEK